MNIKKVCDGVFRGPEPANESDFKTLVNLGIKSILDLENGEAILQDGNPANEAEIETIYGMKCFNVPLGEILPPTKRQLLYAAQIIDENKSIYVHCKAGVDRTGMVIAKYNMIYQRWSKDRAVFDMKNNGMHFWYYFWAWFL